MIQVYVLTRIIHVLLNFYIVGIGYASCLMAYIVAFYYNVVIGWSFCYLFSSFTLDLPWKTCDNTWNSPNCWNSRWGQFNGTGNGTSNVIDQSNTSVSSYEFFEKVLIFTKTKQVIYLKK